MFMFSNFLFESHAVYEITWKTMLQPERPQMALWRMRIVKAKHTHTHTEYVILFAFSLQQWLHERASTVRYIYIARLVFPVISHYKNLRFLLHPLLFHCNL